MNLTLTSFSQDVDLSNPEEVMYFLVFQKPGGGIVRLPVQKETTEELIKLLYAHEGLKEPETPVKEPEDVSDAREFGGDVEEEEEEDGPSNEEEIPSV